MSNLTILRTYAQKADPSSLSPSILFTHSDQFLTIFDAYPKAIFHFLVLPRTASTVSGYITSTRSSSASDAALTMADFSNLRSLLKHPRAKEVLDDFKREAEEVKEKIVEEMMGRYGFKWDLWIGFHAVPSMEHIHLHIISSDLCAPSLKNKKHYNSFHPKEGFFLHLDEVLDLFEGGSSTTTKLPLSPSQYEAILKRPLACFKCHSEMKNMPTLKKHLQEEWEKQKEREKCLRVEKNATGDKRKRDTDELEMRDGAGDNSKHSRKEE
ncbi:HIT-like domain-containing protein [Pterulicium gracile]|uniref:HIT-like domain-containing protein n=1 Tax=Pterulicium gracile TaxID=1884261 RepID=A0A5C3QAA3_9AGAR|nr:HIT-like domain-containing protein [Pterula gracilis]